MNSKDYNAGSKARNDARDILLKNGFTSHTVFNRNHNKFLKAIEVIWSIKRLETIKNVNNIVLQYPYNITLLKKMISQLKKIKTRDKSNIIFLIHDIYYLRDDQGIDSEKLKKIEVELFNSIDALIVHNDTMKKRLAGDGVKTKMVSLQLFDYLTDYQPEKSESHNTISIDFAGNLSAEKSGFLYSYTLDPQVDINLYGIGDADKLSDRYNYCGSYPPEQLVNKLRGDYGLVWDGPSAETCEGNYGRYLTINNPHKMSLYIAARKPLVVWNKSAAAEFVRDNRIGICISNLNELRDLPNSQSEEYAFMCDNVKEISKKVIKGEMLTEAIRNII